MNIVKNIFARIWAIWGMLWFITTMLLIIPAVLVSNFFKEPAKSRIFWRISRLWMNMYLPFVGCPISVKGKEHFAKNKAFIVACNHNSFLDVPLTSPYIPGPNRTIAKIDMMKVPLFNLIYKRGSVLVDRKDPNSRSKSFNDMKGVIQSGLHMCIYPEGTRNKTAGPLQDFKDGAFRLSVETGASIIPCLIFNTGKALPAKKSFYFLPHRLRMHFLPPVAPGNHTPESLKQEVFSIMKAYYETNRK
jgi:1-acyl-sn-glycerol-3-phosphate acyltransferase